MNQTTSKPSDAASIFSRFLFAQQNLSPNRNETLRLHNHNHHHHRHHHHHQLTKVLSSSQFIEIFTLCFILIEHTFVFLLTLQKKSSKEIFLNTNEHQTRQARSIILPRKSLLYNCLHRNWIRAYSFSNICLSFVYFPYLILKHYYPNLVHPSSVTFYSLPLTLLQQILINFSGFHLFIISISILQYFIRSYRLLKTKYSLNIYRGKTFLITKHTNVALILTGSLALIFGYNYIFYTPKFSITSSLLPLITLNMILLPIIDVLIFIFICICCCLNILQLNNSKKQNSSFNSQYQQQSLTNYLRWTIEKISCIKCYSKFLQLNQNLFKESDAYLKLHSKFFSQNLMTSSRPSITSPDEKRKSSTASYETIPTTSDTHTRLSVSHSNQPIRNSSSNKTNRSQEFIQEQRSESERIQANDSNLRETLLKIKKRRSLCQLCHRLLLLFLLKYVLLTFPQHFIQMKYHLRQFYDYVFKYQVFHTNINTNTNNNDIQYAYTESTLFICRFLFLFARFGDSLLLTRLPFLIKNYFPCWCQCNSHLLRKENSFQRPSHQILMKNVDTLMNDPISTDDLSISNEITDQQRKTSIRKDQQNQRFRLQFQYRFQTYSTGYLIGKQNLEFNYTQTISCTPSDPTLSSLKSPVYYLKQLYTLPIYDQNEEKLDWSAKPLLESESNPTCPNGFERQGLFCHVCADCGPNKCEIGYRKNYKSGLCEDINECHEHANICQYMCENQLGSYRCFCPIGFKINELGQCQDVNECRQFQIDCGQDRTCFNTQGAYECIDIPCPINYIRYNVTDCQSKCAHRSTCSPRRAMYIRYRFFALPRLTLSNQILFTLPNIDLNKTSRKLIDRNNFNTSFPFLLDGLNLKTDRILMDSNEYELEIHIYKNESHHHHRRRLSTIYVIQINVSPFHF
ncbi:hypothetical protein I4U23_006508 [Adineta vaga]|nr:hypothetical protein I4U23_006508 [Adineta vaga]